jgi:hypothetical protein
MLDRENKESSYWRSIIIIWFVSSLSLGPNLISQFLTAVPFKGIFSLSSLLVLFGLLVGRIKLEKTTEIFYKQVIILGVGIYTAGVLIASLNSYNLNFPAIAGKVSLLMTLIVANTCMTEGVMIKCMGLYCKLVSILAAFSIIVFTAISIFHIPPVGEFISEVGRVYQNYVIAFAEADIDMTNIKRAGSFYDEPGTFAMIMIPALIWSIFVIPSTWNIIALTLSLIMTFSIGGWLAFFVSLLYGFFLYPTLLNKYKFFISACTVLIVINLLFQFINLDWLINYYDYKFTGSGSVNSTSSVSIRTNEIETFTTLLFENPIGYGLKSTQSSTLSVGVLSSSIEGGILGVTGYFIALFGIGLKLLSVAVTIRTKRSGATIAILAINLSLIIMSFQRIDLFTFHIGIFMCSFMLIHPAKINNNNFVQ